MPISTTSRNPTSLLPPEIVSNIFLLFLDPPDDLRKWTHADKIGPLTLGAVCRSWRSIAWGTPQLWSTIFISMKLRRKLSIRFLLARQWFSRSGELPLSLLLYVDFARYMLRPLDLQPLFILFTEHASRFIRLDMQIPSSLFSHFTARPGSVSRIEELKLSSNAFDFDERAPKFRIVNMDLRPRLVSLDGVGPAHMCLAWNCVKSLRTSVIRNSTSLESLKQASNLDRLVFFYPVVFEPIGQPPQGRCVFWNLRELDMPFCARPSSLINLYDVLELPSLQKFICRSHDSIGQALPPDLPIINLANLFSRSSCPLQVLKMQGANITSNNLIDILLRVPTLEELILLDSEEDHAGCITDRFFRMFSLKNPDQELCGQPSDVSVPDQFLPSFRSLVYKGDQTFTWEGLVNFARGLQSRSTSNAPTSPTPPSIQINVQPLGLHPLETTVIDILELQDSGFNLVVTTEEYHRGRCFTRDLLQEWRRDLDDLMTKVLGHDEEW